MKDEKLLEKIQDLTAKSGSDNTEAWFLALTVQVEVLKYGNGGGSNSGVANTEVIS